MELLRVLRGHMKAKMEPKMVNLMTSQCTEKLTRNFVHYLEPKMAKLRGQMEVKMAKLGARTAKLELKMVYLMASQCTEKLTRNSGHYLTTKLASLGAKMRPKMVILRVQVVVL